MQQARFSFATEIDEIVKMHLTVCIYRSLEVVVIETGVYLCRPDGVVVPYGKSSETGVVNPRGYTLNYNGNCQFFPIILFQKFSCNLRFCHFLQTLFDHSFILLFFCRIHRLQHKPGDFDSFLPLFVF